MDFTYESKINKPIFGSYDYYKYRVDRVLGYKYRLKNYGDKYYKLIVLKTDVDYKKIDRENFVENENKLENNLIRAKNRVFELAMCNDWDWFVTLTLDPKKYDRGDLDKFRKDFSQFLRDERKRTGIKFKYLLVPELHKNGGWHMHGLLKGVCDIDMLIFTIADKVKLELVKNGYYNWLPYSKKFGFVSLGKIKDSIAVSKYCSKYINKSLLETQIEVGAHTYYSSRGLKDCGESIELNCTVVREVIKCKSLYNSEFCDLYELSNEHAVEILEKYKS